MGRTSQIWTDSARFWEVEGWEGMINTVFCTYVRLKVRQTSPCGRLFVLEKLWGSPSSPSCFPFPCSHSSREGWGCLLTQHHPLPSAFQTFHMETAAPAQTDSHRPSWLLLTGSRHRASLNSSPQNNTLWGALDAASHHVSPCSLPAPKTDNSWLPFLLCNLPLTTK